MTQIPDTATAIAVDVIFSEKNLPILPENWDEISSITRQPIEDIDIGKFTKLVETDPAIVARIIRLANSSYFSTLKKIVSLQQAIVHIGLEEVINTVCYLYYKKLLPRFPKIEGFSDNDYWAHSWACAQANKMLGHPRLHVDSIPGELYIMGLLHGLGKLFLALHRPEGFLQSLVISREQNRSLHETELEIIGTTDAHVAYEVLQAWKIPENICAAVRFYASPENAQQEDQEIAGLTQYAYFIANASQIGSSGDKFCVDLADTWISKEGTSPLAQEKTQETYVQEIFSTLRKKSQAISHIDSPEGNDEDKDSGSTKKVHPRKDNVEPKKKEQGLFAWLLSFFR